MNKLFNRMAVFRSLFVLGIIVALGGAVYYLYQQQQQVQISLQALVQERAKDLATNKKINGVVPTKSAGASVAPTTPIVTTATWMNVQRKVKNTVVKIISNIAVFNWLEPYKTPVMGQAGGTGFFINNDGDIVTNHHVIDQARSIQIEIPALGVERFDVELVGASPDRDVALLRLTPDTKQRIQKVLTTIPFLEFGDSDAVQSGQDVLALGYPLDVQTLKSTQGIVSGRERVALIKQSCIQTTAPLNPGNSGGPSLDASGKVIGVNFAGVVQAQNVGYIIPINELKNAIKDLYKIKLLRRPILGCSLEAANDDMISYLGNPTPGGFYITTVFKNMILEKSGVLAGDMIYEINGYQVDKFGRVNVPWTDEKVSVMDVIERLEVGDKVDMVLYRKGERKEIEFILEPRFVQPIRLIYPDFENVDYEVMAGLVVMELALNHMPLAENVHALLQYEAPESQNDPVLIVSYVQPTSLVNKLRLIMPGMIIDEVNGEKVTTLEEFRKAVRKSKKTRFFSLCTKDNWHIVLNVDNIAADEDRLTKLYSFQKSKLIDEIV